MKALDEMLKNTNDIELVSVIEVEVSEDVAKKRVLGRARGADDNVEVFNNRMKVFTEPLKDIQNFYSAQNKLIKINGERTIEEIVDEIKRLKEKGYKDFSLASQDSSSYLRDFGIKDGLERLIDEIDKIDGISVRILYLYPATTTKRLIRKIFAARNVVNYFDMPIQHITPRMLKIMRRPGSVDRLKELLNEMKKEFSFVRTSVIIGHPGETDEDFKTLENFLAEYKFDRVNVFAYSDEEGTPAFKRKDKIKQDLIEERIKEIEKVVKKTTIESLKKYVGKEIECFLDGLTEDGLFYSVRPKIWALEVDGDILINESEIETLKTGESYKVKINELAGDELIGKIIS